MPKRERDRNLCLILSDSFHSVSSLPKINLMHHVKVGNDFKEKKSGLLRLGNGRKLEQPKLQDKLERE